MRYAPPTPPPPYTQKNSVYELCQTHTHTNTHIHTHTHTHTQDNSMYEENSVHEGGKEKKMYEEHTH